MSDSSKHSTKPDSVRAISDKRRRGLVKGIALGLGGATLTEWSRPVVQTVVLPAHAQTSPGVLITRAGSASGTFSFPD